MIATPDNPSPSPSPSPLPPARKAGPTDISDPILRFEARKAMIWLGIATLILLAGILARPLLIIFGGMVFGAMIDGGARLLGRVLPIPRGWRVTIVLLLTAAFLGWTMMFAGSQIAQQAAELPAIIQAQAMRFVEMLERRGFDVDFSHFQNLAGGALGGLGELTAAVGGIIGGLTSLFLMGVLGIYFAAEPKPYQRGVAWLLPADRREHFEETALLMGASLRRLMAGRLLGMVVEGVATWLLLMAYGVPMAALLGLLTGLLAFLPNIGAPISGALMILVGFSGGFDMGIYTIIVYAVVQTVDGNIIVPMVARKTVDLAPALVLGAQLIMGAVFGILGLALADPLVAMLKVWLEREAQRHELPEDGQEI